MPIIPFNSKTTGPGPRTLVGIDLGTTYSLVSILQAGVPIVIPNQLGEELTPSAVSVTETGAILIGAPALARATTHPEATAHAFKRDMGTDRVYKLGGMIFRPQELSALVLKVLKEDAEAYLGRPVDEAVITVPAYFDEGQRRATQDAAAIAGLHVERIINEPTAAALAYGLHERSREFRAVVLDLGGGTFDVTVLEIMEGVIEIQSTAGDARLGGEDFVTALADLVAHRSGLSASVLSNPQPLARLRLACEQAKRRLSTDETTRIVLSDFPNGSSGSTVINESLSRTDAEAAWRDLLLRLRRPVLRALRDASLETKQIDEVLLVGGATRMPCVAQLATELFGKLPLRTLPPDEAVALGAAIQAALKGRDAAVEDMIVTDVAPFSMGIATVSQMAGTQVAGLFSPIIERGTVIPASRSQIFQTIANNQTKIDIAVYQGEHSLCRDNKPLGTFTVSGLPKKPAGEAQLEVRFTYDLNGLLEVEATIEGTGKSRSLVIEQAPGRLSAGQIESARQNMQRLKFHPREALPNTTALAKGEALFVELLGPEREILAQALAQFRGALERQDAQLIQTYREQLLVNIAGLSHRRPPNPDTVS